MFEFHLPLLNGLEALLLAVWKADHVVGKVPGKTNEGGHFAEGNVFFNFPWDSQRARHGINVCHTICEVLVCLESTEWLKWRKTNIKQGWAEKKQTFLNLVRDHRRKKTSLCQTPQASHLA